MYEKPVKTKGCSSIPILLRKFCWLFCCKLIFKLKIIFPKCKLKKLPSFWNFEFFWVCWMVYLACPWAYVSCPWLIRALHTLSIAKIHLTCLYVYTPLPSSKIALPAFFLSFVVLLQLKGKLCFLCAFQLTTHPRLFFCVLCFTLIYNVQL